MKSKLLLALMTISFFSQAQAGLVGSLDKYIEVKTGKVIEVASNEIENGIASYYDYADHKRKTVELSELSKATKQEIAGVKAGEAILVTTFTRASNVHTVKRYCEVFYVFENKQAYVGCKTTEADNIKGYETPNRLDYVISNVESVVAEVSSLDGINKNEVAELRIDTKTIKAGKNVKVLAIFANGEALVQKSGINIIDTSGIINKLGSVERIRLADLNKI